MDKRKRMGKDKNGVIFPIAPNLSEMSDDYLQFIEDIKQEIKKQRISIVLNANSDMVCLYWSIGKAILKKQKEEGWGTKVIDRMAKDLKDEFPDMSGFSPRNIKYMRKFAECWPDFEIVQQVVAQIPWRTNRMLLDKLDNQESRMLWSVVGKALIIFLLHFLQMIQIWESRFLKTLICLISWGLICQGEKLRLNVS